MANREWMYDGFGTKSNAWINGTVGFLSKAFGEAAKGSIRLSCPCTDCKNGKRKRKDDMWKDLYKHGFMANYTTWIHHGERDRIREEVVRPRFEGAPPPPQTQGWPREGSSQGHGDAGSQP